MKWIICLLVFTAVLTADGKGFRTGNIEISKQVMGIPWGASRATLIAMAGKPAGLIQLNKHQQILFYGRDLGFVFTGDRFTEFHYEDSVVGYPLSEWDG